MLSIRSLTAGYGVTPVVDGLDLEVGPGELVALLGANGAGKTTTLRAASGSPCRWKGEISVDGVAVPARPDRAAALGLAHVPQGRRVFDGLTTTENLIAATLGRMPRRAASSAVERVFHELPGLDRLRDRPAGLLSGGEQQMLAIGRAIVARPKAVMIDELTLGLAPKIIASFEGVLAALTTQGTSVLMVEQYAGFARRVADRICVMSHGALVFDGAPAEISDGDLLRATYLGGDRSPGTDGPEQGPAAPDGRDLSVP